MKSNFDRRTTSPAKAGAGRGEGAEQQHVKAEDGNIGTMGDADDLIMRLEQATEQKEMGTTAVKVGDFDLALARYRDATKLLSGVNSAAGSAEDHTKCTKRC